MGRFFKALTETPCLLISLAYYDLGLFSSINVTSIQRVNRRNEAKKYSVCFIEGLVVTRSPKCRVGSEEERKAANSVSVGSKISNWELVQELEESGHLTRSALNKTGRRINTSSRQWGLQGRLRWPNSWACIHLHLPHPTHSLCIASPCPSPVISLLNFPFDCISILFYYKLHII